MAITSAFGAVNSPRTYMFYFLRQTNDQDIRLLEKRLMETTDIITRKKRQLAVEVKQTPNDVGIFWKRLGRGFAHFFGGQDDTSKLEEIRSLEDMARAIFEELTEQKEEIKRIEFYKTPLGKLNNWLGYFFSVYCIYKVVMASKNVIMNDVAKTDPVSKWMERLLRYGPTWLVFDVVFWSQTISFVLVGVMIFTSLRGFLNLWVKIFQIRNVGYSMRYANNAVLFITWIMGLYFTSSILLLRMNLPQQYRQAVTAALGNIHFRFYHQWFDFLFMVSALVFVTIFVVLHKATAPTKGLASDDVMIPLPR
uniref:Abscisic acid G-protein coupled receptor-like domain-containing protein n=1 Tax=Palpitomonas bilix TaxID=652834 RepID=A0A7S3GIX3_9EUKA|mmetsp:Transcript_5450/g.12343  ORF Transcript_5450/g.12343 Transcript_5450/m.12343 type:complete len:308 (+) Transcript_5450:107-1030(+)